MADGGLEGWKRGRADRPVPEREARWAPGFRPAPEVVVCRRPVASGPVRGRPGRILFRFIALPCLVALLATSGCAALRDRVAQPRPWPTGPTPSWQWQLTGELDLDVDAEVFALDPFRTRFEDAQLLRMRKRLLVCAVEVGTYRPDRPDADRFPPAVRGDPVNGAGAGADKTGAGTGVGGTTAEAEADGGAAPAGAQWLDVRQWDILEPVLADRFRLCRGKRFTAVMPLRMDGYAHRTGFPLTFDDQLVFNRRLAGLARTLELSPGLTNDLDQVMALQPDFDFAANEECHQRRECGRLAPFTDAGKPVLHVEYTGTTADFCVTTVGYGFSSIRKDRDLGPWREPCPR